ncbi:hypothetical protein SUGI_0787070 [Cryptomeria japonica]|uniref:abscisic stress-ripening protein 5-like n=1 Tax=Cryptomeria japonica TaxID=3369 RepID=UPI002414A7C7|nr:abscisic stress-ripening protein 5-like [Cryptomeria japonica]GLJ38602.1 hypothetical protein SUGI_0787070 [Cryptomeria japonica]
MSKEHHRHLFHHKKEEVSIEYGGEDKFEKVRKEEKHHKHLQHVVELGVVAAGGFALYEKHQEKKDPENAHRHTIKEEIATAVAVGSGGFSFHEHHEKKRDKKEVGGKKHHHLF